MTPQPDAAPAIAPPDATPPGAAAADSAAQRRAALERVDGHFRRGELAAVVDFGQQALAVVDAAEAPAERFELLRRVSLASLEGGRFETALATAQQALALAQQHPEHPGWLALALNALACCFERLGDPWQAERMMEDALAAARTAGERHPLLVTLNNLVAVQIGMFHVLRDATATAEARAPLHRALPLAREASALVGQHSDDFARVFIDGNLGEVLVHLGERAEAEPLLAAMQALAERIGARAQVQRIAYTRAEIELAEDRAAEARDTLATLLAESRPEDVWMTRLRVRHALWRASRALGDEAGALEHLEHFLRLERQRGLSQLQAQSRLFVTRAEVEQARHEARRDPLTRLGNRREAEHRWPQLIAAAERSGGPLAVAMMDLDDFKAINDVHGHAVGDAVLVRIAALLRENTRAADLVARTGGEEFLLVLPDAPAGRALEVCERLRERVERHDWAALAPGLAVTLSLGLTHAPPYDAQALAARADAALYEAKTAGRNRVVVG